MRKVSVARFWSPCSEIRPKQNHNSTELADSNADFYYKSSVHILYAVGIGRFGFCGFCLHISTVTIPLQDFPNPCISWGQPTTEKSSCHTSKKSVLKLDSGLGGGRGCVRGWAGKGNPLRVLPRRRRRRRANRRQPIWKSAHRRE